MLQLLVTSVLYSAVHHRKSDTRNWDYTSDYHILGAIGAKEK